MCWHGFQVIRISSLMRKPTPLPGRLTEASYYIYTQNSIYLSDVEEFNFSADDQVLADSLDRSTTCRATYDVIQAVGTRLTFPKNKNVAISYVRLLPNDTTLREHQYHMGLADTKICENDDGIEDSYHFFFQCSRHSDIRTKLKQEIQRIWTDSGKNGSPRWSVALLLAPSTVIAFTKAHKSSSTCSNI